MTENSLKLYLENKIPFALFRAPMQSIRLVAQKSPLNWNPDFQQTGFHFAPFSGREKVPYLIIKNDVDILLERTKDSFSLPKISLQFHKNKIAAKHNPSRPLEGVGGRTSQHPNNPNFSEHAVNYQEYQDHVNTYFDFFKSNDTHKAIYSRLKHAALPKDFDLFSFFLNIEKTYPRAFVYLVNLPDIGLWAGASPETLLKYNNEIAETVALAGTQKISKGQNVEQLVWGKKEIEEHQMVADYIFEKIKSNQLPIIEQSPVYTSAAGAMAHLKKRFKFKITKTQLPNFIKNLRPTPAVCGFPKAKALELIYKTEPYDRQYYAGYLGMVEENDTVDFYVNLRCMKIYNNKATLFVGGGITKDSNPQKEWEETELKAKTLLVGLALAEPTSNKISSAKAKPTV